MKSLFSIPLLGLLAITGFNKSAENTNITLAPQNDTIHFAGETHFNLQGKPILKIFVSLLLVAIMQKHILVLMESISFIKEQMLRTVSPATKFGWVKYPLQKTNHLFQN